MSAETESFDTEDLQANVARFLERSQSPANRHRSLFDSSR
jgi:hypothetical protein